MDNKTWVRRKNSSQKTIVGSEQVNISFKGNREEASVIDKALELKRSVKNLNEKLSSSLNKCNVKDDLYHAKVAEEATGNDNTSLKYDFFMLEEELEIWNKGREFNHASFDSSQKKHLESIMEIAELEAECQKLQPGKFSKCQASTKLAPTYELTNASIFEYGGIVDEVSCAEYWASALISELEHLRNGNLKLASYKTVGFPNVIQMDELADMGKLAMISLDKSFGDLHMSSDKNNICLAPFETNSGVCEPDAMGTEPIPLADIHLVYSDTNKKLQPKYQSVKESHSCLHNILRVILEQNQVSERSLEEILEEFRIALMDMNESVSGEIIDAGGTSSHSRTSDPSCISGYSSWKFPHTPPTVDSFTGLDGMKISSMEIRNQKLQSNLNESICKIIDLVEGITTPSLMDYNHRLSENSGSSALYKNSATLTGYTMRVFQWKSSELTDVLGHFVHICNDLLDGKADLEKFAVELTSTLDWIINHCFSLQDVSTMKETIKKYFGYDESSSGDEVEMSSSCSETDNRNASEEHKLSNHTASLPLSTASNAQYNWSHMEGIEYEMKEENRSLKNDIINMELKRKDLEEKLQSATYKNELLMFELRESGQAIASLKVELEMLKASKTLIEDQIENLKLLNEDLDTRLTVARVEVNVVRQKFSSLEMELEDRNNCCEELEATCLELQLQIERSSINFSHSAAYKEVSRYDVKEEEKQPKTDLEIPAASEKLAECQETTTNFFSKGNSNHITNKSEGLKSPKTKEIRYTTCPKRQPTLPANNLNYNLRYNRRIPAIKDADNPVVPTSHQASALKSPRRIFSLNIIKRRVDISVGATSSVPKDQGTTSQKASALKCPRRFFSLNIVKRRVDTSIGATSSVPKDQGNGGLLRKLLLRKKRESSQRSTLPIAG